MRLISRTKVCTIIALVGVAVFMLFACCGRSEAYQFKTFFDLSNMATDDYAQDVVGFGEGPPDDLPPCRNGSDDKDKAYLLRYPSYGSRVNQWTNNVSIIIRDGVIVAERIHSVNEDIIQYVEEFVNKINGLNAEGRSFVKAYSINDNARQFLPRRQFRMTPIERWEIANIKYNDTTQAWKITTEREHSLKFGQHMIIFYDRRVGNGIARVRIGGDTGNYRYLLGLDTGINSARLYVFDVCDDTSFVVSGYRHLAGSSKNLCPCGEVGTYVDGEILSDNFIRLRADSSITPLQDMSIGVELAFLDEAGNVHIVNNFEQMAKTGSRGPLDPTAGFPVRSKIADYLMSMDTRVSDIILRSVPPGKIAMRDIHGRWLWVDLPSQCNKYYVEE